jgi:uncharacterized cofD-like protein
MSMPPVDAGRERERETRRQLASQRVVTIGGGTGPFAMLSALKRYPCSITAIVTMSDSGGSSRRLMDEFGQLPLGDLRQALVALSRKGRLWREVFGFRFPEGHSPAAKRLAASDPNDSLTQRLAREAGVGGHSLGNLIISALTDLNDGELLRAIEDAQDLLDTAGKVLPVTLERATLCAQLADGATIYSETEIDTRGQHHPEPLPSIERIFLRDPAPACDAAIRAIQRADVIVLGPGDLYTSILPNLLVEDIAQAIRESGARTVYVCNLMTKHGETDGFRASDFVREVTAYLGGSLDGVILHDGSFPAQLIEHYSAEQQYPVEPDVEQVRQYATEVIVDRLLAVHREYLVRHDAARVLADIFAPVELTR